jgi:hypothetical protein
VLAESSSRPRARAAIWAVICKYKEYPYNTNINLSA